MLCGGTDTVVISLWHLKYFDISLQNVQFIVVFFIIA